INRPKFADARSHTPAKWWLYPAVRGRQQTSRPPERLLFSPVTVLRHCRRRAVIAGPSCVPRSSHSICADSFRETALTELLSFAIFAIVSLSNQLGVVNGRHYGEKPTRGNSACTQGACCTL